MLLKVIVAGVVTIVDAETVAQAKSFGLKQLTDSVKVDKNVGAADLAGIDATTIVVLRAPEKTEAEKAAAELQKAAKTPEEKAVADQAMKDAKAAKAEAAKVAADAAKTEGDDSTAE